VSIYDELKDAYGNHFQDLFSELMQEKYGSKYQPTSTYGKVGDMFVDGILDFKTAFAVYAPETYKDIEAIAKLKDDFNGFFKQKEVGNWLFVEKYIFVIKRERLGSTSRILNLIGEFSGKFPVDIWTMNNLKMLAEGYLPLSKDGRMLIEFKEDVTAIMEYIRDTDFTAVPFCVSLPDDIQYKILEKWRSKRYIFHNAELEQLKNSITNTLYGLCTYLSEPYVHIINNMLMFKNDSLQAGQLLRDDMRPQVYRMRSKIAFFLDELYKI